MKVYVVVAVLLIAGDQVPVMPLVDVVGSNAGIVAPLQYGPTAANVGITFGLMVIGTCTGAEVHDPDGVNV